VPQRGYATIKLPSSALDFETTHDVLLLGFRKGETELSLPWQSGKGVPKSTGEFVTDARSRAGESGGAWVDSKTGQLLGIASGTNAPPDRTDFVAAYVPLIVDQLQKFVDVSASEKQANPEPRPFQSENPLVPLDRNQWTRLYLQPSPGKLGAINGNSYGVVVGSFNDREFARQELRLLCHRFGDANFALLGSTSGTTGDMGDIQPRGGMWQIETGYNLTAKDADALVAIARTRGMAAKAYKRYYGWEGHPRFFPDCLDFNRGG
jgi:hypothetical protein